MYFSLIDPGKAWMKFSIKWGKSGWIKLKNRTFQGTWNDAFDGSLILDGSFISWTNLSFLAYLDSACPAYLCCFRLSVLWTCPTIIPLVSYSTWFPRRVTLSIMSSHLPRSRDYLFILSDSFTNCSLWISSHSLWSRPWCNINCLSLLPKPCHYVRTPQEPRLARFM